MISNVILVFTDSTDPICCDDIFDFEDESRFTNLLSLEAKVDTREMTLSFLGDRYPRMQKLRLNNSIIPSIRDIGCTLTNLRFLSLARCNISSLDGISTLSQSLEELYLAFNSITDVCDLMGMDKLTIIDLEDNQISDIKNVEILNLCSGLKALTLSGNPAADIPNYREEVAKILPQLAYLDEKRLKPKQAKPRAPRAPSEAGTSPRLKRTPSVVIKEPELQPEDTTQPGKLTAEEIEDREKIMTEMLDDIVQDRPPTARGYYGGGRDFPEFSRGTKGMAPNKSQRLISGPRIVRPMSAKGRN